jgi:CHAT domain-containing protein
LSEAIFTNTHKGEQILSEPSDNVIQSLRDALPTHPQEASLALAGALLTRFVFETHSIDDCEEAIAVLDKLIASAPSGDEDSADQYRARASEMIALLALARSIIYSDPGYSEEAILRCRTALSFSSLDNNLRVVLTQALAIHAEQRFKFFGLADGLQEAVSLVPEMVSLLSSGEGVGGVYTSKRAYSIGTVEQKIRDLEELLPGTTSGSSCHRTYLEDLACWYDTKFSRTGDLPDIEMAIRYRRMLISPAHLSHPLLFIPLTFLCDDLLIAFECTGSIDYLDESIVLHRHLLTIQGAKALHFTITRRLVPSLCVRFRLLRRRQDLDEMMDLCPMAVDDRYVSIADRFKFSCLWAFLARHFGHSSVSSAYESAMSLSQASLAFAPTVQVQQGRLVGMGETCEKMPLDYSSYQIGTGCVEQAIEILERGRTLLWSEMRGFRSSIDQPISSHQLLAEKFTSLNHELEVLTVSDTLGVYTDVDDGSRAGSLEESRMDPFCRLVTRQRRLSKERDALVSHIRSLPGLRDFLTPPSFDALRSAAARGPVIIINHSKWRSDILILLQDSPPSLIPTPSDFYDRANRLKNQLLFARQGRVDVLSTPAHANTVRSVLADLYALVGRPVIERLRALGIPEQSRIWWCPTSAFCYLPLHAMGPIPSEGGADSRPGAERYFSDLYIPSYTPTLSALTESRKPGGSPTSVGRHQHHQPSHHPPMLLVAYHEHNLGGMRKEIKTIQGLRRAKVKSLVGKKATKAAVLEGLEQHRFAHLAGSVKLVPGRPFDAPFGLHGDRDDDRLTLLDIARCRLPTAEFAFLSASHTAELTEQSHPDEALHLAAAMLHCGFRSVVGTMWAMADMDGRDVCKQFYKLMFEEENLKGRWGKGRGKGQGQGQEQEGMIPYHERAAKALRDAVQKLRKKKGITVDRWVTYVHYGA